MLAPILSILLVLGGAIWGRNFFAMVWTFITVGIPTVWDDHIAANRYYRAFTTIFRVAVALPIIGTALALFIARSEDIGTARFVIFMTFAPSAMIFGALLFLANVFAAIGAALFVPGEERRQAIREARIGLVREVSVYLAWELLIGYVLLLVGVDATMAILGISVWGIILYSVACYAYNWPVAWAPYVMTTVGLGVFIATTALVIVMMFPVGRKYAASWGIDPGIFVHGGVMDTSVFTDADKEAARRIHALCTTEVTNIKTNITNAKTVADVKKLQRQLRQREQECF